MVRHEPELHTYTLVRVFEVAQVSSLASGWPTDSGQMPLWALEGQLT
jgi:hypothetical protein